MSEMEEHYLARLTNTIEYLAPASTLWLSNQCKILAIGCEVDPGEVHDMLFNNKKYMRLLEK